jgi:hypothetical protein
MEYPYTTVDFLGDKIFNLAREFADGQILNHRPANSSFRGSVDSAIGNVV